MLIADAQVQAKFVGLSDATQSQHKLRVGKRMQTFSFLIILLLLIMNMIPRMKSLTRVGWKVRRAPTYTMNMKRFCAQSIPIQHEFVDFSSIIEGSKNIQYGDYGLIASQTPVQRTYVETKDLGKVGGPAIGDTVWIRGRVSSVRGKGNACFMVIRSGSFYTVQACHFKDKENAIESKALIKFVQGIALESIVDIEGVISEADVKSCSQKNVEIKIQKIFTVSRAPSTLPFLIEDAARSESEIEATADSDRPLVGVSQVFLQMIIISHMIFYGFLEYIYKD